jgi:hypothetical protein
VKASKILLFLAILAFGTTVETVWRVRGHDWMDPLGLRVLGGRFYGPSFSFEETETTPVPAGATVALDNAFGGVRVSQGEKGQVRILLRKVVFLPNEEEARSLADRVKLRATLDASTLKVTTNRADLEREGALSKAGLESHLEVEVPPGTPVQIKNEHGRVDVADVARLDVESSFETLRVERVDGDASLRARHGDVSVSSVGGALTLSSRHGDVEVRDANGRATIDVEHSNLRVERVGSLVAHLKHGDLQAEDIGSDVEAHGEHFAAKVTGVKGNALVENSFGDVTLAKVEGDARIKTAHGAVAATDVGRNVDVESSFDGVTLRSIGGPAQVKVDHGGVQAHGLAKGATVDATGDDVLLEGLRGGARIVARRGNVQVVPDGPLTEPVSVTTDNGDITLGVPAGSRFDLAASSDHGTVGVSVPDFSATESGESKVKGRVGDGGAAVTLEARHGDVSIEPRSGSASKEN